MPYLIQYQLKYKDAVNGEIVSITINKKSSYADSGSPVITQLTGTENPFVLSVIDNDRSKFASFRAKHAELSFLSQLGITAETFSGPDNEWYVEAKIESSGRFLFRGFLISEDHQQDFLPVGTYSVRLTAIDCLGTLKEIPLTDDSGNYMRGKKKIIDIIAQCLRKTGLQLDIIMNDTWMEESQTSFHPACDVIYLDMKTFEKDIDEAVDCYQALEIIFSKRLSITQSNDGWYISNIDERTGNSVYRFRFDYLGNFIEQMPTITANQIIGRTEIMKFRDKDAIVTFSRPHKFVRLTYNYDLPKEIIDNIDFSRGALNLILSAPNVTIDGKTYYQAKYNIDDWTALVGSGGIPGLGTTSTTNNYIRRLFSDSNRTYEVYRYLVIEHTLSGGVFFVKSQKIYINAQDKFNISVDARFESDVFGSGTTYGRETIQVRLFADDGTYYTLHGGSSSNPTPEWVPTNSSFSINTKYISQDGFLSEDLSQWKTSSAEAPPIPKDGYLEILLIHNQSSTYQVDRYFANLQFDYIPFLNGSYSKYSGHANKIKQADFYKANLDEQMTLGDSPRVAFKGAMFKLVGGKYVLTERWYAAGDLLNQGIVPPFPPGDVYLHPLIHLQSYAFWNQVNRQMVEVNGSVHNLKLNTSNIPDVVDIYQINAATTLVQNKYFVPSDIEQVFDEGKWKVTLLEVYDTTKGKDFSTPSEFRYLSS